MGLLKGLAFLSLAFIAFEGGAFGGDSKNFQGAEGTAAKAEPDRVLRQLVSEGAPLDEQVRVLEELVRSSEGESIAGSSFLKSARLAFAAGEAEVGRGYLAQFIEANEKTLQVLENDKVVKQDTKDLIRYMIATRPEGVRKGFVQVLGRMNQMVWQVFKNSKEEKLDSLSTLGRKLAFRRTAMQERSADILSNAVFAMSKALEHADEARLLSFLSIKGDFFYRFGQALDALASRWGTCEDRALDLEQSVERFVQLGRFYERRGDEARLLSTFLEREKDEQIFYEAYVTRENVAVGITAALILAEGTCALATGGICLAATTGIKGVTMMAVRGASRAYAITTAATDLVDQVRFNGWKQSLTSPSVWIDLLVILAAGPRPTVGMMKWAPQIPGAPGWLNTGLGFFQPGRGIALGQHQAGWLLFYGGLGYSYWQYSNADRVSRELFAKGYEISPQEIRRKSTVSFALALLGGMTAYREYKKGANGPNGEEYKRLMEIGRAKPTGLRLWDRVKKLWILNPPIAIARNIADIKNAPVLNSFRILGNLGALAYDAVLWTNLTLMSVSYADWNFNAASDPLPDLGPGEIALVLNGFSEDDLLYYSFNSDYSQRVEIEKYGANLYRADFKTPQELIEQIRKAGAHGKIRYLKIQAHGLPGRLYAAAPDPSGGSEYISAEYMDAHSIEIKEMARSSMAQNANVRLVSCLVGSNFKKATVYERDTQSGDPGEFFEQKAGDLFVKAFGETFLSRGGTLDSSRRIIAGFDAVYGAGANYVLTELMLDPNMQPAIEKENERIRLELVSLKSALLASSGQKELTQEQEEEIVGNVMVNSWERIRRTYEDWRIFRFINTFGLKLEGNPWTHKHRKNSFPALQ